MKLNRIIVTLCALALAVPAVVMAKGPSGDHGKSTQPHGKATPHTGSQKCKHQPMVGYTYGGKLAAGSTASTLLINVTHANKFAQSVKTGTQPAALSVDASKITFDSASPFDASGNANAGVDLTKYAFHVSGKVGKPKAGCTWANSTVTVRKVVINGPSTP